MILIFLMQSPHYYYYCVCHRFPVLASGLILKNWRTSTGIRQATTPLRAHAASSMPVRFLYPKIADVLFGLQVRPVGDKHLAIGLRAQRLRAACRAQSASELPDTASLDLLVEHLDIALLRFVPDG